ncbi:carbamoyltransferase [Pontibacter ummariensis]|uniref:Carbamoyltransferase n=1 Tax=Pontibacter ummariensis TaxID=1610492 RepID=A0A239KFG4_9BACT|nr:carbamoyltransferase C-terminal domain-containing protein [Pontibacter ummariensis]PRY06419.1 carbamoyltransferase [Pontibacter ummariensis]SNT16921.1 carbamoyltransferase [Pontibacter ummariensis]
MLTLGINAAYHDSAACLVEDGRVIAAAEEERFTRIKHGKRPVPFSTWELPYHAIDYCLREAGTGLEDVDHVAYSFDPYVMLGKHAPDDFVHLPITKAARRKKGDWDSIYDPLFLAYIVNAPNQLVDGYPHHLQESFRAAKQKGKFKWHFVKHHLAHAASAFYASPFERAACMTLDGRGEDATTTYSYGEGKKLELLGQVNFPHSLGLLYESVTADLGFLHSSDEYKVMALASYGEPCFLSDFREIIQLGENGNYELGELRFEERFGKRRKKGEPFGKLHFDIARSLQFAIEEAALALADQLYEKTKSDNLVMAGGVALNCVMNAYIRDKGKFRNVWVQPAAGDAGTALGAALRVDAQERGDTARSWEMTHPYLGPGFSDEQIEEFLKWSKLPYRKAENIAAETAKILAEDKIVGWFQGRMEFGPRALGARSILASPINPDMQAKLNDIKDREDFRPVAPAVLEEEAAEWFVGATKPSPFMLFVFDVREDKAERLSAVRHVDGTARVQTVRREQNPVYYDLIKEFQGRTGVPVLVNTSFNTRGEPVVCTPRDAIECFWTSPLDALAIGSFLLEKR